VEAEVRALARVVEYAVWLRTPDGPPPGGDEVDHETAKRLVHRLLVEHPDGVDLELGDLAELLRAYGIELEEAIPVTNGEEAVAAGKALGWGVVLKATADHLRERPDLAHVWRNIDNAEEMTDAWTSLGTLIADADHAGFVVQRNARPGVPVAVRSIEDPLFGPVVSFGISGPLTELLADKSFRIPPLGERDAAAMVREIKSSPMLFGYRGSEVVDVAEIERLIRRVSQLQNDLPQVSALALSLVLAGAEGATVLTASARVDPVADPRSDWFVRRLTNTSGDTLPG
jgi:hypothetical protein